MSFICVGSNCAQLEVINKWTLKLCNVNVTVYSKHLFILLAAALLSATCFAIWHRPMFSQCMVSPHIDLPQCFATTSVTRFRHSFATWLRHIEARTAGCRPIDSPHRCGVPDGFATCCHHRVFLPSFLGCFRHMVWQSSHHGFCNVLLFRCIVSLHCFAR